jgi:hypothetical protein
MSLRALKRFVMMSGALSAMVFATVASAKTPEGAEAPEPATPEAATPTESTPSSEALPSCSGENQGLPPCNEAQPPEQAYTPPPPTHRRRHNIVFAPGEVSIATGAGPANYFGSALTASTDVGAAWDARATFGTHSILALEAGYVGSLNNIDVPSGTNVGRISSNGLDGTLRVQLPYRFQPYIFAGVGWNFMHVDNGNANPNVTSQFNSESNNQVTIPAGGGFAGYIGHVTLDLRGTYRLIPDNDITITAVNDNHVALHQWYAQARVGYAF